MFRNAVFNIGNPPVFNQASALLFFGAQPAEVLSFLEDAWDRRDPVARPTIIPTPPARRFPPNLRAPLGALGAVPRPVVPPHAIEAYTLENTRIVEIFRRVIGFYLIGEQLAAPPDAAAPNPDVDIGPWLRTTETLFFSSGFPLSSFNVISGIRPDFGAVRRNLYYRLFGYDLNHGADDNRPFDYIKPAASNREFGPMLERLLAEIWRGIVNATNTSGRRDTDDAAIANLCLRVNDMLGTRRRGGNLQREEFFAGAMVSWFHLAILWNSPIVRALKAEADSPAERLQKIGERVGLPAHGRSAAFIQLGPLLGWFLDMIERGAVNDAASAPLLYATPSNTEMVSDIITLYITSTGRDIKASAVTVSQRA
jgi:hypothetical protein